MKILLDHCTPRPLRQFLKGHEVTTAEQHGWDELTNGDLLDAAEEYGIDVFVTTDNKMEHQQNLQRRRFATVFIKEANWLRIRPHAAAVREAVLNAEPQMKRHLELPDEEGSKLPSTKTERADRNARKDRSKKVSPGTSEPPFEFVIKEQDNGRFNISCREKEAGSTRTLLSAASIRSCVDWLASKDLIPKEEAPQWERKLLEDLKRDRERKRGR